MKYVIKVPSYFWIEVIQTIPLVHAYKDTMQRS